MLLAFPDGFAKTKAWTAAGNSLQVGNATLAAAGDESGLI